MALSNRVIRACSELHKVVRLSTDELQYCIHIGTQRQETNMRNRIASKQFTSRDPTNIHIQGVLGEFVFGQICMREFKEGNSKALDDTSSRGSRNDTFDWNMFGKKIDVKTTLSPYVKNIYARAHKFANPADLFVMISLSFFDAQNTRLYVPTKAYDEMLFNIQRTPKEFVVEGGFGGFATSQQMFASPESCGSFSAPLQTSWTEFCSVISSQISSDPDQSLTHACEHTKRVNAETKPPCCTKPVVV